MDSKLIVRNTGLLFVSEVLVRVFSFFLIIMMARFLGDSETGKYFFAVSYVSTFQVLADFGVITLMFREISTDRKNAKTIFEHVLSLKLILLIIILFSSIILFPILYPSAQDDLLVLALVSIYFFFVGMISPFNILFNAFEKLEHYAAVTISQTILAALIGIFFLLSGKGLVFVLLSLIFSYLISFLIAFYIARTKYFSFGLSFDVKSFQKLIIQSFPFWMTSVFMIVFSSIDNLMLKHFKDYSVIGIYNVALKLVESLGFIPFILIGAVFPAMALLHHTSNSALKVLFDRTFYYMFVVSIPIAFGTTFIADRIIFTFYGTDYLPASLALKILIWSSVFMFVNFLLGYLLNAIKKAEEFTLAAALSLLCNVVLNFILIPMFDSFEGAAISLLISQIFNFVLLYLFVLRNGYSADLMSILKPFLSSFVMFPILYYLSWLNLLILIPLAACAYIVTLFLIGGFGKREIDLIKGALNL